MVRSPLQVQAYDYLKEMILSGKLEPGVLYSETRMSAEIGVSRTPMREAIQCLSQDGYITVVPSKGFMLRSLNEQDMEESIQIRCAIEGFCVQVIATEAEIKKGQKLLAELEKLLEKQERTLQLKHGPREENIQKRHLEQGQLESVYEVRPSVSSGDCGLYRESGIFSDVPAADVSCPFTDSGALSVPGRTEDTLKEHKLFYSYLKDGDGDAAYKLMMVHLMMPLTMHLTKQ